MFLVQLKGTDVADLSHELSIRFKVDTLTYYRKLDLPVMIVLFHSPSGQFFWKWAHEVDTYYAERGQDYITVRMLENVTWVSATPSLIEKDLLQFRGLRSPSIHLPQTFSVIMRGDQFHGTSRAMVESALASVAADVSDFVSLSRENPAGAHPSIVIDNAAIVVSLSGLSTTTLHTTAYPSELVTTKLSHDILTAVALVFDGTGHSHVAAQIACRHLDKSTLLSTPAIFFAVLRAIAKGHRFTDGLRLAEALLRPEMLLLAQVLLIPALMHGKSLQTSETEYLRHLMKRVIEGFEAAGMNAQAATAHYNLGNHLRAQGYPYQKAALKQYQLASKLDPLYRERHYFWREVGGVLFGLDRFGFSARAYERAIRLGGGSDCVALRADALMFAGRYSEADELFVKYMKAESRPDTEWVLKSIALPRIMELSGVEKQVRVPRDALRLADVKELRPEAKESSLLEALRKDALSGLAWFNLGVESHPSKPDEALFSFLIAGLVQRNDVEAWAHAALMCIGSSKYRQLAGAIAVMAYRINSQRFLDEARNLAERQGPEFPTDKALGVLWEIVSSEERPKVGFEFRILGEGASFQSTQLGPNLTRKTTTGNESNETE